MHHDSTESPVIAIADIDVGERRREDYGDMAGLAASIRRYGLLHPVVVDDDGRLVAGERRLRACQDLGWTSIPSRNLGTLSEPERREIELEENLRRKDLTSYEASKIISERAAVAGAILQQDELPSNFDGKPRRGRPSKPDSRTRIAERVGVPPSAISQAQQHVEVADEFPCMRAWPQYSVLEARTHLERLPESERPLAVAVIDAPGIPAKDACSMLRNIAEKPPTERDRLYRLRQSPDSRERSLAVTEAIATPPMPDPREIWLDVDIVKKGRRFIKDFPDDPLNDSVTAVIDLATAVLGLMRGTDGSTDAHA